MGQYVFLLYFHLRRSSLTSLFPEHGGISACVCVSMCTYSCIYVFDLADMCMFMYVIACVCMS